MGKRGPTPGLTLAKLKIIEDCIRNNCTITETAEVVGVSRVTYYRWRLMAYERNPPKKYKQFRDLLELKEAIAYDGYKERLRKRLGKPIKRKNSGVQVTEVPTGEIDAKGNPKFIVVKQVRSEFTHEIDRDEQIINALIEIHRQEAAVRKESQQHDPIDPNITLRFVSANPKKENQEDEAEPGPPDHRQALDTETKE